MIKLLGRIICKFTRHKWDFYVHDFGLSEGLYGKRYKDVMYCVRCGEGDLRK